MRSPVARSERVRPAPTRFSFVAAEPDPNADARPQWNALRRELTLGGKLVKRFRQRPGIQEHILQTFEEEGWPEAIDDPLPGRAGKDAHERLHNAIQRLNRCQKEAFVRFERDGTGSRILWRVL